MGNARQVIQTPSPNMHAHTRGDRQANFDNKDNKDNTRTFGISDSTHTLICAQRCCRSRSHDPSGFCDG